MIAQDWETRGAQNGSDPVDPQILRGLILGITPQLEYARDGCQTRRRFVEVETFAARMGGTNGTPVDQRRVSRPSGS